MIPTIIIPSMNPILCEKALSFIPPEWPRIVKDGNPTRHFEELKGLDIKTRWAINVDEDCFLINPRLVVELLQRMEREGYDTAAIQDGASHMRYHNPVLFNPFFFAFDVKKLQAVKKQCVDPVAESRQYEHLVKYRDLPYKFDGFEPYYPFFVDLLHAGMRPLYLPSRPFHEFPQDGTNIEKPSILLDPDGRELAVHAWYSRLYHEPVVQNRIRICEEYAAANPHSMRSAPRPIDVTVLIPAHNAERTLAETLESLVQQTFKDFQVLIVDDASTDRTAFIAEQFKPRLRIDTLHNPTNLGVAGALNQGIAAITTKYIARIDADDIALPDRLEKQYNFLEAHPGIAVCSTWMDVFYEDDSHPNHVLAKPLDDATIRTALVQYCSMSHGASMFRKSFFDDVGHFDPRLDYAEDYDLWCRGALLGKRYANLPEPLTRYRKHSAQVGVAKRDLQYSRDLQIKRKYLSALLNEESSGHLAEFFHPMCAFSSKEIAVQVLQQSMPLLSKLAQRVPNPTAYWNLVSGCIGRHVR